MNIFRKIWNWLTGQNSYGKSLLDAITTQGPLSYNKNSSTGETTGGLSSLMSRVTQDTLTGAENAQNAFNAEQAEINRNWQEHMSNTAYQRAVADMQAAGVNPALAMTGSGSGASTPSGSTASGSAGSSAMGLSELLQLFRFKKEMKMLDAQIGNIGADSELKGAQAENARSSSSLSGAQTQLVLKQVKAFDPMNQAELDNLHADLQNKEVQRRLNEAGIKESEARRQLDVNNALLAAIDAQSRDRLNQLNAQLRVAQIGETYARTAESRRRVDLISAEIDELFARSVLETAEAGHMNQATINLAIEADILRYNSKEEKFTVDHQNADRNWRIAGQVIGNVIGVTGAAAGLAGGIGVLQNSAINAARLGVQQQSYGYTWHP